MCTLWLNLDFTVLWAAFQLVITLIISGDNGIVAKSGVIHFMTPDGGTSFRVAGGKAELRAKKFNSLSEKRKFQFATLSIVFD